MPRHKPLIPRTKNSITERNEWIQTTKKRPIILTLLLCKYNISYKEICLTFGMDKRKWSIPNLEKYLKEFYIHGTLEQFDYLCGLMPNHKPKQILELIYKEINISYVFKNKYFAEMIRIHDKACYKKMYEKERIKKTVVILEMRKLLESIVFAESYEEQREAIVHAQNRINKISFSLDEILSLRNKKWD